MAVVQFNLFFACLATLCLLVHSTHTADVRYCNKKASYDVKVSGVEISPYPVARGKNTTFSIAASTDKVLSGGKMVIDVSYFFLHVYQEIDDLCSKTPCPVSAGDFVISHSQVLPGITPPQLDCCRGEHFQQLCIGSLENGVNLL
ncbi:unnamed protein product [Ilex paraguariensis]|uniref:MD-2-related lipid-recognition domain-containing protein n=1 Tax=Ilex paraguariensis TaxID=185542 RepID=A0ABC8SAY7_9AQUA